MVPNTLHCRHIFIFFCQLPLTCPWQIVPLINQQRCPTWSSHAGQFCLISLGHFRITQQGLSFFCNFFKARRNRAWRSAWTGIFLHPCSKLCIALEETPNNRAIWLCVFPRYRRIVENSFFPTQDAPFAFFLWYHIVGTCKGFSFLSLKKVIRYPARDTFHNLISILT